MEQSPIHEFSEVAQYNITLKLTDSVGNTNFKTDKITIETLEITEIENET